jgi:hypothetical protein
MLTATRMSRLSSSSHTGDSFNMPFNMQHVSTKCECVNHVFPIPSLDGDSYIAREKNCLS